MFFMLIVFYQQTSSSNVISSLYNELFLFVCAESDVFNISIWFTLRVFVTNKQFEPSFYFKMLCYVKVQTPLMNLAITELCALNCNVEGCTKMHKRH